MRWIEVNRCGPLCGTVRVPGSKNSSLGLLAACCLSDKAVTLKNIPDISDVRLIYDIGREIGLEITHSTDAVTIDPANLCSAEIPLEMAAGYRASYYFVGALLAKFKRVKIGYPGGDNFGSRPIDQHIKGFEALGAEFEFYSDHYIVKADKLTGSDIYFDMITCGATINVMLAAVLAQGRTTLRNAARDPEVVDVAVLLNKMGANIKGAGTETIVIEGVECLGGCTHTAIPDRLIAGTYFMAVGAAGGDITIKDVTPEHLMTCIVKLQEAGMKFEIGDDYVRAYLNSRLDGIKLETAMYPGFATDYQQPLTAMLTGAASYSKIAEKIYPGRINHCTELNKMGADIFIKDEKIIIPGNRRLHGAWVKASDIRAGICLILAGLTAKGTTYVTGVEHIERGYSDLIDNLVDMGANIRYCSDSSDVGLLNA